MCRCPHRCMPQCRLWACMGAHVWVYLCRLRLHGLPYLAEGIYWATGLSLTTPFTERPGVNNKASPPGRHQEQAPKQRCTFRPTTFSSVQYIPYHTIQPNRAGNAECKRHQPSATGGGGDRGCPLRSRYRHQQRECGFRDSTAPPYKSNDRRGFSSGRHRMQRARMRRPAHTKSTPPTQTLCTRTLCRQHQPVIHWANA